MITEERREELTYIYYTDSFGDQEFTDEELYYFAQLDRCNDYWDCGA